MKLYKFVTSYGDGQTVTYYRAVFANDKAAIEAADAMTDDDAVADYEAACDSGLAGAVTTEIEEIDPTAEEVANA